MEGTADRWGEDTVGDGKGEGVVALRVTSSPLDDGGYAVEVAALDDVAFGLDTDEAAAYARGVMEVALTAMHETAVWLQLMDLGIEAKMAGMLLAHELRAKRPAPVVPGPLEFIPVVGAMKRRPLVTVRHRGKRLFQLTPAQTLDHAAAVQHTVIITALDTQYRALMDGFEEGRGRMLVSLLGQFMDPGER